MYLRQNTCSGFRYVCGRASEIKKSFLNTNVTRTQLKVVLSARVSVSILQTVRNPVNKREDTRWNAISYLLSVL